MTAKLTCGGPLGYDGRPSSVGRSLRAALGEPWFGWVVDADGGDDVCVVMPL